jgi:putative isomerase
VTGEPLDQPDTDGFYGWGALMPAMAVGDVVDVTPWSGWEVTNDGTDVALGPVETPAGAVTVTVEAGLLAVRRGDDLLLETDLAGVLTHLVVAEGRVAFTIDGSGGTVLRLPGARGRVLQATAGGRDLVAASGPDGLRLTGFEAGRTTRGIEVVWSTS